MIDRVVVVGATGNVGGELQSQPSEPGWIDMALDTPIMATTRATTELHWQATRTATDALR